MKTRTLVSSLCAVALAVCFTDGARGAPQAFSQRPGSPVADAAMRGDRAAVRSLLEGRADVNVPQGDGMSALHWAAWNGDAELASMLIRARADVNVTTRNGDYTPLHLAARGGHVAVVQALLAAGSDPEARTTTGAVTPLHFAADAGNEAAVIALLERGAAANAKETTRSQTPLMFAAAKNRVAVVRALLARGADHGATTRIVDLPSLDAVDRQAERRRNEVLASFRTDTTLVGQARRPTPAEVQSAIRAAQEVQRTLTTAESEERPESFLGSEEVAGYSGLVGRQGGFTALLHAVREGHAESAVALLDAGADVNQVSGDHTSPLLMATINGHFDLALLLLGRGADPDLPSDAGAAPLFAAINTHWAPRSRYPQQHAYTVQQATYLDVMKALLAAGADVNARLTKHVWYMSYTFDLLDVDTRGASPFWRAAYATDGEAMRLLVAHGADLSVPTLRPPVRQRRGARAGAAAAADPSGLPPVPENGPGIWPIHAASGVGYGEGYAGNAHRHAPDGWLPSVQYLVEALGADVNARDHNGYTPLHHAAARGDNELILYLVSKGADVTAISRRGQTTADMANGPVQRISPFPETVALLEKLGSKNNHRCMSC